MFKSFLSLVASLWFVCVLAFPKQANAADFEDKALDFGHRRDLGCSVLLWLRDNGMMVAPRLNEVEEAAALSRAHRFLNEHQASSKEMKRFAELDTRFTRARREGLNNVFAMTFTQKDLVEILTNAEMIYFSRSQSPPPTPGLINELGRGFKAFKFIAVSAFLMVVGVREMCSGNWELGVCASGSGLGAATYFINSQRGDPLTLSHFKIAVRDRISDHNGLYLSSEFVPRNFLYNFFFSSETYRNFSRRREFPVNQRVRIDWFAEMTPRGAEVTLFVDADEAENKP